MDRYDPDRSSSRASSVSGRSQSARSWNSLPPDERELAKELESQHLRLESRGSTSNSSNASQPRDRLQAAEAAERDIEVRHSQSKSLQQPRSGTVSPAVARSAADSGRERQSNARSGSGSSGNRQVRTSEVALGSDSSASGASKEAQQVMELQAKNQALEAALRSRDAQATQIIADCTDIDNKSQEQMAAIQSELADAVKARKKAEDERDAVEVKAAGDKAKSASSLAAANADRLELQDRDRKTEANAAEAQTELEAARWGLSQSKQRELVQSQHQEEAKELSDCRIEELEGLLNSANRELAQLRRESPSLGSTASARETSLQDQIDLLIEERTRNRKDMSEARLELLGLKKKQAMQAIDQAKSPAESRQANQAAGGGGGRSRGRGRGRGAGRGLLEIIEEEDEEGSIGLPARAAESVASECDSSDCGDLDDLTIPDQSAQNDLLKKLLAELTVERKAKQDMRDNHAGQYAEHAEEIAQLQRQLAAAGVLQETTSAENVRLQSVGKQDKIKQLQQVDDLQVKVRELEETVFVEMRMQTDKEQQQEITNAALQEKVQLQAESLRISNLRLQDALQQQQTEAVRQLREMNSLRLQLAVERRRNAGDETHGAKDDSPEESLHMQIKELEEERNLLLSKIEVQEVQHQVQLEDACRDHASRLQEQRVKFEEQIAEVRSRYEQLLRQRPVQGHSEDLLLGLGLGSNLSSLSAEASYQAKDAFRQADGANSAVGVSSEASTPASQSTGGTAGTSFSDQIRSMIWAVLGLVPNAVAVQCAFDDLVIQKATARAGAIFSGMDLIGMSFFSLLRDKSNSSVIRRMMLVNQSMADSSQSEIPSFVAATLGRFGLQGIAGQVIDGATRFFLWLTYLLTLQVLPGLTAIYDDPVASEFVWGMAYHWYGDARFETWPPRVEVPFQDRQQEGAVVKELKACAGFENVRRVADLRPDKHLLFTEGCQELGERPLASVLGDWKIAERYAMNIIADMNSGCEGWIDWNLVLDQEGGPNHVGNNCVAPVICDTSKDAVLYQPAFWYLGHFSRYIRPGAQRLLCSTTRDALEVTAYKNVNGAIAVVVLNQSEEPISFWLKVKEGIEQRATALLAPACV
ncbi:GBA [Symbiodinium sp. CCMP2592]|nr:GBA [Symbiodinium sp. CCMP2592]